MPSLASRTSACCLQTANRRRDLLKAFSIGWTVHIHDHNTRQIRGLHESSRVSVNVLTVFVCLFGFLFHKMTPFVENQAPAMCH